MLSQIGLCHGIRSAIIFGTHLENLSLLCLIQMKISYEWFIIFTLFEVWDGTSETIVRHL